MTEFKREERYIVLKRKNVPYLHEVKLREYLKRKGLEEALTECVVVENDWPIYEIVWQLVERIATGHRLPFMTDEDPDEVKAERDKLENEASDLAGQLTATNDALTELKEGRDALVAHVEEGREVVEHSRQWVPQHVWTRLWLWKEKSPTTSLAHLIADHVDAAIGHAEAMIEAGARPGDALAAARRQAEETS